MNTISSIIESEQQINMIPTTQPDQQITLDGHLYILKKDQTNPKNDFSSSVLNKMGKPNGVVKYKGWEYNLVSNKEPKSVSQDTERSYTPNRSRSRTPTRRSETPTKKQESPEYIWFNGRWYALLPESFVPPKSKIR